MLFVDWISPANHQHFNNAFFNVIGVQDSPLVVFHEALHVESLKTSLHRAGSSRWIRFWRVWRAVRSSPEQKVFLLTYDPLLLPLLRVFVDRTILVFEHNTTPERHELLKALFQRLFYGKIGRLCQYPGQLRRLLELDQNAVYLGSPLGLRASHGDQKDHDRDYWLCFPSPRSPVDDLVRVAKQIPDSKIFVKHDVVRHSIRSLPKNVIVRERLKLEEAGQSQVVFLISLSSDIRGSGWYNEAINRNALIVHLDSNSKRLFEETFPNFYSFELLEFLKNVRLKKQFEVDHNRECVVSHNTDFRIRFEKATTSVD